MSRWPPGVFIALGTGVLSFAFAPILVRLAGDVPGLAIASWRTGIAAAILLPGAVQPKIRRQMREFSWADSAYICLAGACLGIHFILWIESLFHTTVASASVSGPAMTTSGG